MHWIAKPFVLLLQFFFITKNNTLFQKTRTKLAATEGTWRLASSPIAEKNMCIFYVVVDSREKCIKYIFPDCFQKSREICIGDKVSRIFVKNVQHVFILLQRIAKLQQESAILSGTGESRRRQQGSVSLRAILSDTGGSLRCQ